MSRQTANGRRRRRLLWLLLALMLGVTAVAILPHYLIRPPLESMRLAFAGLSWARAGHADLYLPEMLSEVETLISRGEQEIARVNSLLIRLQSYDRADSLLREAIQLATRCADSATGLHRREHRQVQEALAEQRDNLAAWEQVLASDLIRLDCRSLVEGAGALLTHADALLQHGLLVEAVSCIDEADSLLSILEQKQVQYSERVAQRRQLSKVWLEETIAAATATGDPVLVVDKAAHQLLVLFGRKIVRRYDCDLGFNAAYQKRRSGDGATPEGKYKVVEVRSPSKYYRALLLDYPNKEDRERFQESLRQGVIDSGSRIGGLIEIHGHGGLGFDWTDGCVAVTDKDMDEILQYAPVGTQVTIVRDSGLLR
ncbi:MAG: L,D-transpeptidase [bacterium]